MELEVDEKWFTCIMFFKKLSKSYFVSGAALAGLPTCVVSSFAFSVSESESDESDDDDDVEDEEDDEEHNLMEMFIHWNSILLEGFVLYLQNMFLNVKKKL